MTIASDLETKDLRQFNPGEARRKLIKLLLSPELEDRETADLQLACLDHFSQEVPAGKQEIDIDYFHPFKFRPPLGTARIEELTPGLLGALDKDDKLLTLIDIFNSKEGELVSESPGEGVRVLKRFGIDTDQEIAAVFFTNLKATQERLRKTLEAPLPSFGLFSTRADLLDLNIVFNYWQFREHGSGPSLAKLEQFLSADKVGLAGIYLFGSSNLEQINKIIEWGANAPPEEIDWLREVFSSYANAVSNLNEAKFLAAYYPQQTEAIFPTCPIADFGEKALTTILEGVVDFTVQNNWQVDDKDKSRIVKLLSAASVLFYPSHERSKILEALRISPTAFRDTLAILTSRGGREGMTILGELTSAAWRAQSGALGPELEQTVEFYKRFFGNLPVEKLANETTGDTATEIERTKRSIEGLIERTGIEEDNLLVVEVGIGTGRVLSQIKHVFPQASVLGVDILSREFLSSVGLPADVPFVQGDIVQIDQLVKPQLREGKKVIVIAPWSVLCDVYEPERFDQLWRSLKKTADYVVADVPAGYFDLLQQGAEQALLPPFTAPVKFEIAGESIEKPFLLLPPLAWLDLLERRFSCRVENFPPDLAGRQQSIEEAEANQESLKGSKDPWSHPIWTTQKGQPRLTLIASFPEG